MLQVWFAFSGNGSQWSGMALSLMEDSSSFLSSIQDCAAVVDQFGIDLIAEFKAKVGWKTPLLASLGLITVQIGLVDLLRKEFGIVPAGMIGHSAGRKHFLQGGG